METIIHFSHPHPLKKYSVPYFDRPHSKGQWNNCHLCSREPMFFLTISDDLFDEDYVTVYACKVCNFLIHESCSQWEEQLSHPFHPEHNLFLCYGSQYVSKNFGCDACRSNSYTIHEGNMCYRCHECNFNLGLDCILCKPIRIIEGQTSENSHPHPIFEISPDSFHQEDRLHHNPSYICSICGKFDALCVCILCKSVLHKSCALTLVIRHPFHSEHLLSLIPITELGQRGFSCNACSKNQWPYRITGVYYCSKCDFSLDVECASLMPTSSEEYESDGQLHYKFSSPIHPFPLIPCETVKEVSKNCSGCDSPLKKSIFVCLERGILLDQSCAELLPEIEYPFHPLHPLKLVENLPKEHPFKCRWCGGTSATLFTYICWICDFQLDARCASMKPVLIKTNFHEHPVAFVKSKIHYALYCSSCHYDCRKNCFQCMDCKFALHIECCSSLPEIIKHDCHCDPLTFTYSRVKEVSDVDSDEEFYCHACEESRELDYPTYYCKDCRFVSHLECVLTEILRYLEIESATNKLGSIGPELPNNSAGAGDDSQALEPSPSVANPTQENSSKDVATEENIPEDKSSAEDDVIIKEKITAIDEEIEELQKKLASLKDRKLQLATSARVASG